MKYIFLPMANVREASVIPDVEVIGVESLRHLVDILIGNIPLPESEKIDIETLPLKRSSIDFSSIHGQEQAKRALLIAAAG